MSRGAKTFLKQEAELRKRERQIEDLIREKNQLRADLTKAEKEAGRLRQILVDIAFAEEAKARQIARRALDRIERKIKIAKEAA